MDGGAAVVPPEGSVERLVRAARLLRAPGGRKADADEEAALIQYLVRCVIFLIDNLRTRLNEASGRAPQDEASLARTRDDLADEFLRFAEACGWDPGRSWSAVCDIWRRYDQTKADTTKAGLDPSLSGSAAVEAP